MVLVCVVRVVSGEHGAAGRHGTSVPTEVVEVGARRLAAPVVRLRLVNEGLVYHRVRVRVRA